MQSHIPPQGCHRLISGVSARNVSKLKKKEVVVGVCYELTDIIPPPPPPPPLHTPSSTHPIMVMKHWSVFKKSKDARLGSRMGNLVVNATKPKFRKTAKLVYFLSEIGCKYADLWLGSFQFSRDSGTKSTSLWPSDVIWCRPNWAEVMDCCLTPPSHYLTQCWLTIKEVSWHWPKTNFTGSAQENIS